MKLSFCSLGTFYPTSRHTSKEADMDRKKEERRRLFPAWLQREREKYEAIGGPPIGRTRTRGADSAPLFSNTASRATWMVAKSRRNSYPGHRLELTPALALAHFASRHPGSHSLCFFPRFPARRFTVVLSAATAHTGPPFWQQRVTTLQKSDLDEILQSSLKNMTNPRCTNRSKSPSRN